MQVLDLGKGNVFCNLVEVICFGLCGFKTKVRTYEVCVELMQFAAALIDINNLCFLSFIKLDECQWSCGNARVIFFYNKTYISTRTLYGWLAGILFFDKENVLFCETKKQFKK